MSWSKLEKGMQFADFPHEIRYGGITIRNQEELDGIIDLHATISEAGGSDEAISEACIQFLQRRRLH